MFEEDGPSWQGRQHAWQELEAVGQITSISRGWRGWGAMMLAAAQLPFSMYAVQGPS